MKDRMARWFRYAAEDVKAAQAELDELAEQGWELAELGIFTASFRRAQRPRRCWVELARWKSIRRKDEQARADYLALCDEAGWDLLDEAGGLFYFQAKPDADPAPIQTDEGVEWEEVLKKSLGSQASCLLGSAVYWGAFTAARIVQGQSRMWTPFLSNSVMLLMALLLIWVGLGVCLSVRVVRYRRACRRAVEAAEPIPVPGRWAARFRGAAPLLYTVLGTAFLLVLLAGFASSSGGSTTFDENGYSRLTVEASVLANTVEYRKFSEQGDLWLESYECKVSWLARIICGGLRKTEGDEKQLHYYNHYHGPVELTETDLGYDQAWTYSWGGGNGLIFRQGNRVVHIESERLDLTDKTVVESLLDWLDQAACAREENMVA